MASFNTFQNSVQAGRIAEKIRREHKGENFAFSKGQMEILSLLRNMVEKGVNPTIAFSDNECNIWEMFALVHNGR